MSKVISLNNKVIVEPFKGSIEPESKISNGIAFVSQKNKVVSTTALVDFQYNDETYPAGSKIYFVEEILAISAKFNKVYTAKTSLNTLNNKEFIIIDLNDAVMIEKA